MRTSACDTVSMSATCRQKASKTYIDDVLLEDRVGTLLVVGDDELVALGLQELTETELYEASCISTTRRGNRYAMLTSFSMVPRRRGSCLADSPPE